MLWYQSQKKIKITNQHKNINVWESIGANDAVLKQKKNVNFYNIQRENWKAAFFITSLFSHNVIDHSKWQKLMVYTLNNGIPHNQYTIMQNENRCYLSYKHCNCISNQNLIVGGWILKQFDRLMLINY